MKNQNFNITTKELAQICGVSQGTVDRALNGRSGISSATRARILTVAREYGYLEGSKSQPRLMGIVVFDLYNQYFAELVMHFEAVCKQQGYSLVVMFTDKDCEKEKLCIKQLYYMGVSGIVLCPVNEGPGFTAFLTSLKVPVVTVGNRLSGIDYVGIDNYQAMYEAAMYLAGQEKKILYYSPALREDCNDDAQRERRRGFLAAMKESRAWCETRAGKDVKGNVESMAYSESGDLAEYRIAESFSEVSQVLACENDWAVLCSTDHYLLRVLTNFPGVRAMGFDNVSALKQHRLPAESVDGGSEEVARRTLSRIEARIRGEKTEPVEDIVDHRIE